MGNLLVYDDDDDKGNKIKFGKINPCLNLFNLYSIKYRLLPLRSRILSARREEEFSLCSYFTY